MSLNVVYKACEPNYAVADRFGSISESHQVAISQIQQFHLGMRPQYKILDLGVGDGYFLDKLKKKCPNAIFTGVDVSSEMLAQARANVPLITIEANAADTHKYLPLHSQDLVLAHFINACIPINTLFEQANLLTKASGHFSLITTTYDSFPFAQRALADFIAKDTIMSSVVGHYYKAIVKNTTVAANLDALMANFAHYGFQVVAHQRIEIPIILDNIDDLAHFGLDGTWFLNTLSIRMLPKSFIIERIKRLFSKIFTFPYRDTHIIDVILAKK